MKRKQSYLLIKMSVGRMHIRQKKYLSYIDYTTAKLSRRLTLHVSDCRSVCHHLKKHNCLEATYRNILDNNRKILQTDNNVKKLKILEPKYIKFIQPTINKINFETSDNISKCLKLNNPY